MSGCVPKTWWLCWDGLPAGCGSRLPPDLLTCLLLDMCAAVMKVRGCSSPGSLVAECLQALSKLHSPINS